MGFPKHCILLRSHEIQYSCQDMRFHGYMVSLLMLYKHWSLVAL
jgi:hypothetical protein